MIQENLWKQGNNNQQCLVDIHRSKSVRIDKSFIKTPLILKTLNSGN